MSSDPPRTPNDPRSDWRHGAAAESRANSIRTEGVRWKRLPKPHSGGLAGSTVATIAKWLASLAASIASVAAIVYLLFLPSCSYTLVAPFIAPELVEAFAPPAQARQDEMARSREHFPSASVDAGPDSRDARGLSWSNWLHALRQSKPTAYIFYLSATSIWRLDANGQPQRYFLLSNSEPDGGQESTWVAADSFWSELAAQCRRDATLGKALKLVLIDTGRSVPTWRGNGFGSENFDDFSKAAEGIPQLAVLTSCAPGERSWGSHQLGTTAFLRAVTKGLAGEADTDGIRGVHLDELLDFVTRETHDWVTQNRTDLGQSPQRFINPHLAAAEPEQKLVLASSWLSHSRPSWPDSGNRTAIPQELSPFWTMEDAHRKSEYWRTQPLRWRDFCFDMEHAERLWLAGAEEQFENFTAKMNPATQLPAPPAPVSPGWISISPGEHLKALHQTFGREHPALKLAVAQSEKLVELRDLSERSARAMGAQTQRFADHIHRLDQDRRLMEDQSYFPSAATDLDTTPQLTRWKEVGNSAQKLSAARETHERLLECLPGAAEWVSQLVAVREEEREFRTKWIQAGAKMLQAPTGAVPILPDADALRLEWKPGTPRSSEVEATLELTDLFDAARELAQELRAWETHGDLPESQSGALLARLESITVTASRTLKDFEDKVRVAVTQAKGLSGNPPQWEKWQQITNLLAYRGAAMTSGDRETLWEKSLEIERTLANNTQDALANLSSASPAERNINRTDVAWRSYWALQQLSLAVPASASAKESVSAQNRHAEMVRLWKDWKECVEQQDAQKLHGRWVRLSTDTKQFAAKVADLATDRSEPGELQSFEEVRKILWDVDLAVRALPGYDAHKAGGVTDRSTQWPRWLRIEQSAFQARRYLEDFYAGTDGAGLWFANSAAACIKSAHSELAQGQFPNSVKALAQKGLDELTAAVDERRQAVFGIQSAAGQRLKFGTESKLPLTIEVQTQNGVPAGFALVTLLHRKRSTSLAVDPPGQLIETQSRDEKPRESRFQLTRQLDGEATCVTEELKPRVWFRGHLASPVQPIPVDPCEPIPWTVATTEPPPQGAILVQGRDRKSLMLVFDCSESMNGADKGNPPNLEKFFYPALRTLKQSLGGLNNQTPPYEVGLVAYGHRYRFTSEPDKRPWKNLQRWKGGFDLTLEAQLEAAYRSDYQTLHRLAELRPGKNAADNPLDQLNAQIDLLEKAEPFGNTPLLGAIIHAIDDLPGKKAQTGCLIVAITDGAAQDDGSSPAIPDRRAALKNRFDKYPNINLCIVGYNLAADARIKLRNLDEGANRFRFLDAPNPMELQKQLSEAIRERPYEVKGDVERSAKLGEPVTGLPRGNYEIRFPGFPPVKVTIDGGERLVYQLDHSEAEKRIRHEPHPELDRKQPAELGALQYDGPSSGPIPDRLVKYRARQVPGGTEIVVAMDQAPEDSPQRKGDFVKRPEQVQFLLSDAKGEPISFSSEVYRDQSVPAWRLFVDRSDLPLGGTRLDVAMLMARPVDQQTWPLEELTESKKVEIGGRPVQVRAEQRAGGDGGRVVVLELQGLGLVKNPDELLASLPWIEVGQLGQIDLEFLPARPIRQSRKLYFDDDKVVYEWQFEREEKSRLAHLWLATPRLQKVLTNGNIPLDVIQ